jgi:hypothetical protein
VWRAQGCRHSDTDRVGDSLVDANDEDHLRKIEEGITHHRVRKTAPKGIRCLIDSWASHTFNEAFVGGCWRRLNHTRLGQPSLDGGLYGLTIHILSVRDWSEARMRRTAGKLQSLNLLDDIFRTANPYATIELSDEFGVHAKIDNPETAEDARLESIRFKDAFWVCSLNRPASWTASLIDLQTNRLHMGLSAETTGLDLEKASLSAFWDEVPREFAVQSEDGCIFKLAVVCGFWVRNDGDSPYLHFILCMTEEARVELIEGASYRLPPKTPDERPRFLVVAGLTLDVP